MSTSTQIKAPATMVGTAKKNKVPVRWTAPNGMKALVYGSGQVFTYALESEREKVIASFKTHKENPKVELSNEEAYKLKVARHSHNLQPIVAFNVRKCFAMLRSGR